MEFIHIGRVYRCVVPRPCAGGYVNDRVIVRVNLPGDCVQYDGPAVPNGRRLPTCTLEAFKAWAGEDVTDKLPVGEWQPWPPGSTEIKAAEAEAHATIAAALHPMAFE